MAQLLNRVQPGDLITAQMWNEAVDAINQLLQSRPVPTAMIGAVSPRGTTADPIHINTILQITGQNFGYSNGSTRVIFEGPFGKVEMKRGELLTGSSDTRLLLIVPAIPTMTESGMTLTLRVDSGISQDMRSVFVAPVVIDLSGDMFVDWRADLTQNPRPNPLTPGRPAEFGLQLRSALNRPATFKLIVDIKDATALLPPGFVESIELVEDRDPITSIDVASADTRNLTVRVPDIPTGFSRESFRLEVTAVAPGVKGAFSRTFTVGETVRPTDPSIERTDLTGSTVRSPNGAVNTNPANGQRDGTTIQLREDFRMTVMYNVTLTGPGGSKYTLSIGPKRGTSLPGWSAEFTSDTGTPSADRTQTALGPGANQFVKFVVRPSGTTIAPRGTLVFHIQRQGEATDWLQEFPVTLIVSE